MDVEYVIVQAGGMGSRLKELTTNKPKAIVSIDNIPMIFHLFRKYPTKKFIIIADYKKGVLERYLEAFCDVKYIVVGTDGEKGTCSGIKNALSIIPPNSTFMLIWSDLVLGKNFCLPIQNDNYIGISNTFSCRWMFDGTFREERSSRNGVAGLFIFTDKQIIMNVPNSGEFVKWLQSKNLNFKEIILNDTAEYGLRERISSNDNMKCRPFNTMEVIDNHLIKQGVDEQGRRLAVREKAWYKHVSNYDIPTPHIFSFEPLTMELIDGKNISDYDYSEQKKNKILVKIMDSLKSIHSYDSCYPDKFSMEKAYYTKTMERLSKVRNLIPFANEKYIVINGKRCRNVFFFIDDFHKKVSTIRCDSFTLIHGDCTFSNMILRGGEDPVFIDPRGYFGDCEIVGDPSYDWAKLYYSVFGDYDKFNRGKFKLDFGDNEITLKIETNGWKGTENTFISNLPKETDIGRIRFIHSIIWLSLTTYAWNDYDSICGAFYNGLYYLEDVL